MVEYIAEQLYSPSPSDASVEINTLKERVDLDGGLSWAGQSSLCSLTGSSQSPHGTLVTSDVLLVLSLELLDKVIDQPVVKVFTSQVSVTSGGLHLKYTIIDLKDGHIKGTTSQIKDKHISLMPHLQEKTNLCNISKLVSKLA